MNNKSQVVKLLFANLRNHPVRDNMELEPAPIHVAYIVENYSFRTAVFKSIDNMNPAPAVKQSAAECPLAL